MSLFPEYLESLELSPSHHWQDPKSENHIQRQSMNKLVMDYLITGKCLQIVQLALYLF